MQACRRPVHRDPPVRRPDAQDLPPQVAQDSLAQAIPVTRRRRPVIGRTITFDPGEIPSRMVGMHHRQVDPE